MINVLHILQHGAFCYNMTVNMKNKFQQLHQHLPLTVLKYRLTLSASVAMYWIFTASCKVIIPFTLQWIYHNCQRRYHQWIYYNTVILYFETLWYNVSFLIFLHIILIYQLHDMIYQSLYMLILQKKSKE